MNIERLYPIGFIICAIIGAIIGRVSGHGVLRGMTNAMIIAALPVFLLILIYLILMAWRPDLPVCRCGKCRCRDYRYAGSTDSPRAASIVHFECPKCGRVYEKDHGSFNELLADGQTVPYMNHTKWGRWKRAKTG